ncbi:hypothetical protein HMPREF1600_04245 [Escherichia coli 907715]|nr:hypothetical protein HMPREF1600_04245 [Escherichia coli 907715]
MTLATAAIFIVYFIFIFFCLRCAYGQASCVLLIHPRISKLSSPKLTTVHRCLHPQQRLFIAYK